MNLPVEIVERHTEVDGLEVHWRQAGDAPILYLHGVPTASWEWEPFLALTGGVAPDLPGFGRSGQARRLRLLDSGLRPLPRGLLRARRAGAAVAGGARLGRRSGLAFAQRFPERIERLVVLTTVPLLPGYRWHRVARAWRTPAAG